MITKTLAVATETLNEDSSFWEIVLDFIRNNGFLLSGIAIAIIGIFFLLNGRARESGCFSGVASIVIIIVGVAIALFGYFDAPLNFKEIFQYDSTMTDEPE